MAIADFEKLGSFYLGKQFDLAAKRRGEGLVLYDSRDLVTHAVCVGMTGSGKTGLCLGILEEAAIDGIPAIVIDPKGDLSNLLLTFPQLRPEDFRPWINAEDAIKQGVDPGTFAAQQASLWHKGLEEWGQDGARIQRLKDSAEFSIYTPGSSAGLSVSVLKSFDAPSPEVVEDGELFGERVAGTALSLLAIASVQAGAQSREHVLLSAILTDAWSAGTSLDLASIIRLIQQPPFTKLGVMELESVFPAEERFKLAMALNTLVAAPGFAAWLSGDPLDIGAMLITPAGKPKITIFSIAHLDDAQRMFFVSLLMNQILSWTRQQSGTTSLRALVYMDEIAGYFPPVANPPSKQPMLTLMKQGRAFGVGMVLATQNPVDLDYKGLANAGTWFIGRLQTERDKQRVLDGLEGAAASASAKFDRKDIERALSQLGSRVFLMNNVHEDGPVVFETRWCLSYLRGPMTRQQIKSLMDPRRDAPTSSAPPSPSPPKASPASVSKPLMGGKPAGRRTAADVANSQRPVLPPEVPQYFLKTRATGQVVYVPMLLGIAKVLYDDKGLGLRVDRPLNLLAGFGAGAVQVDWDHSAELGIAQSDLLQEPEVPGAYDDLPEAAGRARSYAGWSRELVNAIYRIRPLKLMCCGELDVVSNPDETESQFRSRLIQHAREHRDATVQALRREYAPRVARLQERLQRARSNAELQRSQSASAKVGTALSVGAAVVGAFFGRKVASVSNIRAAESAIRGVSRSTKESRDLAQAEETVEQVNTDIQELNDEFKERVAQETISMDVSQLQLEPYLVEPFKKDIAVKAVVLVWAPHLVGPDGELTPEW